MFTPIKAIRAKCLDCCCGSSKEVARCPTLDCSLYPYRFGKNPNRAGIGNGNNFSKNSHSMSGSERACADEGNCIPQPSDTPKEED